MQRSQQREKPIQWLEIKESEKERERTGAPLMSCCSIMRSSVLSVVSPNHRTVRDLFTLLGTDTFSFQDYARNGIGGAMGKYATHYTDEELAEIKNQWIKDKKCVDEEYEGRYQWDRDKEYERYFNNVRIRKLFHHAAFLYRGLFEAGDLKLHPNEKQIIVEVYRRLVTDGYYTQSKTREKEVSAHLGKIISRQYRPKNK